MIEVKNLTFRYANSKKPSLEKVNLTVNEGDFILLAGPTGSGKSTLLKALNGLIPNTIPGFMEGFVKICGVNTKEKSVTELSKKVGIVLQNPDDQIFSTICEDEVAFGPENLCIPKEKIIDRVNEAMGFVGLSGFQKRYTNTLSGGQKQRLVISSIISIKPKVLLLDEPLSQLDHKGTKEVLEVVQKLNRSGVTIILVEHKVHKLISLAKRVLLIKDGKIVFDKSSNDLHKNMKILEKLGLWYPTKRRNNLKKPIKKFKKESIKIENLYFRYNKKGGFILKDLNLSVKEGEILAIMGENGCGKSTLFSIICGLLKPESGKISISGPVGFAFQNPALMFFNETVRKELEFGPKRQGLNPKDIKSITDEVSRSMGIFDLMRKNPFSLSGGQRLRVAVSSVLTMKPKIILLDEPTSGQDRNNIETLFSHLEKLSSSGATIIFSTHDVDVAKTYADRIALMDNGKIVDIISPKHLEQSSIFEESLFPCFK